MPLAPRRGRTGLAEDILHLFVLSSFAVAQPVLDLLARQAEFLVASDAGLGEIVLVALFLLVAVPGVIAAVEIVLHAIAEGLREIVHIGVVFALVFLAVMPVVNRADQLPALAIVLVAASAGAPSRRDTGAR